METISIAMATYNGSRHLREQLESFLSQTRAPDELVVTDDGSSDDTVALVEAFAREAPFRVEIVRNKRRLGYGRNFGHAISQCSGDIIFLSDQDDVWFPEKLARVEEFFRRSAGTLVVINDAALVNERLEELPSPRTHLSQLAALGLAAEREHVTGCCTAFRREFREILLPIPDHHDAHDNWLHTIAARIEARAVIRDVLQFHRRHGASTTKWIGGVTHEVGRLDLIRTFWSRDPRPGCERRRRDLIVQDARFRAAPSEFWKRARLPVSVAELLAAIESDRTAIEFRCQLLYRPRWRRLVPALLMLVGGQYRQFQGWKTFMMDSFVYR